MASSARAGATSAWRWPAGCAPSRPELEAALDEAERLLASFPDALREAHEYWWLDVVRGSPMGLPAVSAVLRAALHPRAPGAWRAR